MTEEMKASVRSVFQACQLEWWVLAGGSDERFYCHIEELMAAVRDEYHKRHGGGFDPMSIFNAGGPIDWKTRAFLQAVSASHDPAMLVMVWRILQGMNLATLDLTYQSEQRFELRVTLKSPYGEVEKQPYVSNEIESAALVRHIGIMRMNNRPIFAGFYPLKPD